MTVVKIAVMAIVGIVLLSLLKHSGSTYSIIIQLGLVGMTIVAVLPEAKELLSSIGEMNVSETISSEALKIMLKIFGMLTIGTVTADICRDNGENALADTVEISVKILAMVSALPVFKAVINVATSFINR